MHSARGGPRAGRLLAALAGALLAAAAARGVDETNVTMSVEGTNIDGVLGYKIEFIRQSVLRTDSRRLGLAYSPDDRRLQITVTQKGLNRLQAWLNLATDGGTPDGRTVVLTALNEKNEVLVRWELTGVVPTTLTQQSAGTFDSVTATMEFLFDRMRLVEARGE